MAEVSKRGSAQRFEQGSPRVLVAGATGFAGALAAHLVWRHPGFELAGVTGRSEIGRRLDDVYTRYRVPLRIEELDFERIENIDAAIVAYPHAAAAPTVGALLERGLRVIDLSADFRLAQLSVYEHWYGEHPRPDLLEEAVYGLPELHRDRIARAAIVANPGCYPTAAVLALAPLAREGLIADVVIDAKQGISGAGRTAETEITHLSYTGENIIPYKVAGHRHTPEMEEQLTRLAGRTCCPIQFQPHLVALDEGELVSCYVTPARDVASGELHALYASAYDAEPFVEIVESPPGVREMRETNFCRIFAATDAHTGKLIVFSAIDNLWKGTSSQAIQNLNLMFDMPETEGLL